NHIPFVLSEVRVSHVFYFLAGANFMIIASHCFYVQRCRTSYLNPRGVTTFNLAFASSSVHSILEVPTSAFRYTTTLVSVMLMPLSISLMLAFIAIPLIPIAMLNSILSLQNVSAKSLLSLKMFSSTKELSITLMFGRVFACITIFYIASSFLSDNTWYSDRIEGITKSFAYSFEMEQHSYCKLEQNQKVAYLNNELVIIGTENDGSYLFSISRCEVEL
ncbi:hypothetical protein, partial [Vibrio rotiferianus]